MTVLPERTLKVGVASYKDMKACTMAIARGEHGRITPRVTHNRVELDLPVANPR